MVGPAIINFHRVTGDPVYMGSGFLGVPQFRHFDHPEDHRPGNIGPLQRYRSVSRKMGDQEFVLL